MSSYDVRLGLAEAAGTWLYFRIPMVEVSWLQQQNPVDVTSYYVTRYVGDFAPVAHPAGAFPRKHVNPRGPYASIGRLSIM